MGSIGMASAGYGEEGVLLALHGGVGSALV